MTINDLYEKEKTKRRILEKENFKLNEIVMMLKTNLNTQIKSNEDLLKTNNSVLEDIEEYRKNQYENGELK